MANTYSPILTKGTEASLHDFVEGKLRFTTDTGRIFLDTGSSSRIEYTDFVKDYTEEQILALTTGILPKMYMSSDTFKLFYYDNTTSTWKAITSNNAAVTSVNGQTGDVVLDADDIGLGNVGNFKAVSTVANQGLTSTEQENARANIGAGTSNFDGQYSSLTGTPTLGTASALDVATSGDASTTQVVKGDDTRLTDARPASDVSAWAKESTKPTYTASEVGAIPTTDKGANNGVATLDSAGKIPSSQLPSSIDEIIEGYLYNGKFYEDSAHTTEIPGEASKIYVDLVSNKTYRFSNTTFVEISESLALGETSSTAFRGDYGKAAYDHSLVVTGNPHNVTKSDVGLGNVGNFKAVSTEASQGLTTTEQANARANIGAGTSSFDGAYSSLTGAPSYNAISDQITVEYLTVEYADIDYIHDIYQRRPALGCILNFDANLQATINQIGITSNTPARVYYRNEAVAKAAKITSETIADTVVFTAQKTPIDTVIVDIFYDS